MDNYFLIYMIYILFVVTAFITFVFLLALIFPFVVLITYFINREKNDEKSANFIKKNQFNFRLLSSVFITFIKLFDNVVFELIIMFFNLLLSKNNSYNNKLFVFVNSLFT